MAVPSQTSRPQFRRRLLGYAPQEVDAYVEAGRADGGDVVSARVGAEMATVLRNFASSIVETQQRAEAEVTRLHHEAVAASAALRADAEARAALLLERAETMRLDAEAAAEEAAQRAPAQHAALREMAHEMVETVLADATQRFEELGASRLRARQALDEANAELQRAQATLDALASPDTEGLRARAHEVVDLIALEAELDQTTTISARDNAVVSSPDPLHLEPPAAMEPAGGLTGGPASAAGTEHHQWSTP